MTDGLLDIPRFRANRKLSVDKCVLEKLKLPEGYLGGSRFWKFNLIIGYLGGSRLRGNDKLIGVGTGDSSLRWNRNAKPQDK
ncbi:MAG: hypothetical protein B7X86_10450 [Sphingobacteriales bacterium 17-39-43]|nr:MAG: hypothetical protein B7Y24_10390 [Sphingobacteriales bacterium 16-39-50]OZA23892.1 MAG: hypothetical protein B7X86_10450 [Sphingobacteriales bacterium 17-39-43]